MKIRLAAILLLVLSLSGCDIYMAAAYLWGDPDKMLSQPTFGPWEPCINTPPSECDWGTNDGAAAP